MIFHPTDSDFLLLVGESDVRLVALETEATVKKFPVAHNMTCETDAVAVHPSGQFFYVATNFSRRVICFAAQGGAHVMWDVSTFNEELEDDEADEHSVQSLSFLTRQGDQGDGYALFFAGIFQNRIDSSLILFIGDRTPLVRVGLEDGNLRPYGEMTRTSVFSFAFTQRQYDSLNVTRI